MNARVELQQKMNMIPLIRCQQEPVTAFLFLCQLSLNLFRSFLSKNCVVKIPWIP